jgi:competence protein ComEA
MKQIKAMPLLLVALLIAASSVSAKNAITSDAGQIDINRASVEELATIPHIGAKKAERIVAYRLTKPFASIDELVAVKGIGPKMLAKVRPYVTVKAPTSK